MDACKYVYTQMKTNKINKYLCVYIYIDVCTNVCAHAHTEERHSNAEAGFYDWSDEEHQLQGEEQQHLGNLPYGVSEKLEQFWGAANASVLDSL